MASHTQVAEGVSTPQHTSLGSAYSPSQILNYLNHISFPLSLSFPRNPQALTLLHRLQITTIPYENLSLHYNTRHINDIDPQALYQKFVGPPSRGRGGYCFETAIFWLNILRGLGFTAYHCQASIRLRDGPVPKGDFVGPRHVVTIVEFGAERWVTDVGFGGDGMTAPLPLIHSLERGCEYPVHKNLGSQEVRITRGLYPGALSDGEANMVWFYEYRNRPEDEWNRYYAFGDREASSWDLECANYWVSAHPESFQRKQILVVKFLRGSCEGTWEKGSIEAADGCDSGSIPIPEVETSGKIMLAHGVVKRNLGGKTDIVKICQTEEERIEALKEYFGIIMSDDQKQGIKGFETALT
jgi:arylamine N-acetyltransferase